MSRIRDKLRLLHKPLSTPRSDLENFPAADDRDRAKVSDEIRGENTAATKSREARRPIEQRRDSEVPPSARRDTARGRDSDQVSVLADVRRPSLDVPTALSDEMRQRLDRLMKVGSQDLDERSATKNGGSLATVRPTRTPEQQTPQFRRGSNPKPTVRTSGGFTVSQRAFDRWRKERVDGVLPSPVVVREKLEAVRERDEPVARRKRRGAGPTSPRSGVGRPVAPNETDRAATGSGSQATDVLSAVSSVESHVSGELEPGDRHYFDTVSRLAHLSSEDAIRRVLDSLDAGVSAAVRVHAFRTLASLSEEAGSLQHAIAAYDALSTLCPEDPLPHRELYRLYQRQPSGSRRACFHLERASKLAPWDGGLKRLSAMVSGSAEFDDGTPYDA